MQLVSDVVTIPIESREQWLEMRKRDVTASDVAATCGVNPYRSALDVWADKFGGLGTVDNKAMQRGRWLEPGVIEAVRDQYPEWKIETPRLYVRSPSLRIGATPDAVIKVSENRREVLQCKVVARSAFEEWGHEVPLHYQLQVLTESALFCPGAEVGWLAALVISEFTADLELFKVPIWSDAWAAVCKGVASWWSDVDGGRRPRVDYSKDAETLKRITAPDGRSERLDLSDDNRLLECLTQYRGLGESIRILEDDRERYQAEIVDKLGGVGRAKCGPFNVSYTGISVDEKIVKAYSFNRLTVTQPKPKA